MKVKFFVIFSCILFLLGGWNHATTNNLVQNHTNEQKRQQKIVPNHDQVNSPNNLNAANTSYILSIKGVSPKLTPSAWQRMLQWRRDILVFPERYPNDVFLNGPNKKMVALTFDDGPEPIITPKIVAALKQENVNATFFFIGEKVRRYPNIVKLTYQNGNVISSHSFRHDVLTKKKETELHQDLENASKAIHQVIGKAPALLRPPYGEIDDKLVNAIKKDDYKAILWSIDTLDWSNRDQAMIQQNVLNNVRNGDIILMHTDDYTIETAKAVPAIIKELKRRGYQIVDVATLLNTRPYK